MMTFDSEQVVPAFGSEASNPEAPIRCCRKQRGGFEGKQGMQSNQCSIRFTCAIGLHIQRLQHLSQVVVCDVYSRPLHLHTVSIRGDAACQNGTSSKSQSYLAIGPMRCAVCSHATSCSTALSP